jgi:hypothetical protein
MVAKLKRILLLLLGVITIYISSGTIVWADDVVSDINNQLIAAEVRELTPQKRQQLQGIRQKRNREINAVLNSEQKQSLSRNIHRGDNLNQALEKLKLEPQQQKMVQAIRQLSDLKMQAASN